jgi:hypothetical protein
MGPSRRVLLASHKIAGADGTGMESSRRVLLVGNDLAARARVETAAALLPAMFSQVPPGRLAEALQRDKPEVLILDLDQGREPLLEELKSARERGLAPPEVIGYYSHVDAPLARAAKAAGCRPVPRGKFWSNLIDILRGG